MQLLVTVDYLEEQCLINSRQSDLNHEDSMATDCLGFLTLLHHGVECGLCGFGRVQACRQEIQADVHAWV